MTSLGGGEMLGVEGGQPSQHTEQALEEASSKNHITVAS